MKFLLGIIFSYVLLSAWGLIRFNDDDRRLTEDMETIYHLKTFSTFVSPTFEDLKDKSFDYHLRHSTQQKIGKNKKNMYVTYLNNVEIRDSDVTITDADSQAFHLPLLLTSSKCVDYGSEDDTKMSVELKQHAIKWVDMMYSTRNRIFREINFENDASFTEKQQIPFLGFCDLAYSVKEREEEIIIVAKTTRDQYQFGLKEDFLREIHGKYGVSDVSGASEAKAFLNTTQKLEISSVFRSKSQEI